MCVYLHLWCFLYCGHTFTATFLRVWCNCKVFTALRLLVRLWVYSFCNAVWDRMTFDLNPPRSNVHLTLSFIFMCVSWYCWLWLSECTVVAMLHPAPLLCSALPRPSQTGSSGENRIALLDRMDSQESGEDGLGTGWSRANSVSPLCVCVCVCLHLCVEIYYSVDTIL